MIAANNLSDLTNFWTARNNLWVYSKSEVDTLISNFGWFEVVSVLPSSDIKSNVIYLLWPIGSWADKYEEWIYYSSTWTKIWETTVDLSNYFNTSTQTSDAITEGSTNLFLTSSERTKLGNTSWTNTGDQTASDFDIKDLTDSTGLRDKWTNKQNALTEWSNISITTSWSTTTISATDTTYTASDFDIKDLSDSTSLRTTWNWKQDKLTAGTNIQIAADGKTISATDTTYTASDFDIKDLSDSTSLRSTWSWKQDALVSGTNIKTVNGNSILGSGKLQIDAGVTSVNTKTWAVTLNADDISDSTTTNKFVTASDKNTWDWKQDELQSWVNIRTINWTSVLWSWNIDTPTGIPSQTWEAGKFLTTDWSSVSWGVPTGWIQCDPNSPIQIDKIRCWTEDQYSALQSYSEWTAYLTV